VNIEAPAQKGGPGRAMRSGDLLLRTASAVVLLGIAIGAALLGGAMAGAVAGIFAFVVLHEWTGITGGVRARAVPFGIAVAVAGLLTGLGAIVPALLLVLAAVIVAAVHTRTIWLPAGVVYAAVLAVSLVMIRVAPELGFEALIFVLAVVWATDSGAFFAGRTIGGPKLAPRISPKKTWAGALGGLLAALFAGVAACWLVNVSISLELIAVALSLSIVSQVGDLFESWVKRRFDAKDSGSIIPGHGGVMDRVDGLTFAAAAAVVIGAAHAGAGDLGRGILIW